MTDELRRAIESIEDNNKMYDAKWSDWQCVQDMIDIYRLTLTESEEEILNKAIETNGESLKNC